jgi:hypothetical protein
LIKPHNNKIFKFHFSHLVQQTILPNFFKDVDDDEANNEEKLTKEKENENLQANTLTLTTSQATNSKQPKATSNKQGKKQT